MLCNTTAATHRCVTRWQTKKSQNAHLELENFSGTRSRSHAFINALVLSATSASTQTHARRTHTPTHTTHYK